MFLLFLPLRYLRSLSNCRIIFRGNRDNGLLDRDAFPWLNTTFVLGFIFLGVFLTQRKALFRRLGHFILVSKDVSVGLLRPIHPLIEIACKRESASSFMFIDKMPNLVPLLNSNPSICGLSTCINLVRLRLYDLLCSFLAIIYGPKWNESSYSLILSFKSSSIFGC